MSYNLIKELLSDILNLDDIMFSINSGSGICEVRAEKGLPIRISHKWLTIGHEDKSWHIHLNLEQVPTARFVIEPRQSGMSGYSIRFFDSKGNVALRANFIKMYNNSGNLIPEKSMKYDEIFKKYGKKEEISFSS